MKHLGKNPIVILGAGGFAKEVCCWASHVGWSISAFYDEFSDKQHSIFGIPVVSDLSSFGGCLFLPAIGDPKSRMRVWGEAVKKGLNPAEALLHRTAIIGENVRIGAGSVICPYSVLTADIILGEGVILNLNSTIGHDVTIDSFVTVSPGVNISGNVHIGRCAYIGTNTAIREKLAIGSNSVVGMGSVVTRNVPNGAKVFGNPAKIPPSLSVVN